MENIKIRAATLPEVPGLLTFWSRAAEGTSITDDQAGVARLIERDPEALIVPSWTDWWSAP